MAPRRIDFFCNPSNLDVSVDLIRVRKRREIVIFN